MNKKIYVDNEKCTGCGMCSLICSGFVLLEGDGGKPVLSGKADDFCFSCGQCISICPNGALNSSDVDIRDCKPID